jgi:UDP-2,3-diacylglucosamine pyrophosphatase LpxH
LRAYDHLSFGNIVIADEIIFKGAWITHGDKFDSIVMYKKWLAVLGSAGYEITIVISEYVKKLRKFLGLKPRSFSKWIKSKVKGAVSFIDSFEYTLTKEATLKNCETVICGHIHTPADKRIGNSRYLNTGDWIENYSYIVYQNGKFTLNYYETERLGDNSHTRKK